MKIVCTKNEWDRIHKILIKGNNCGIDFKLGGKEATCVFYDAQTGQEVLNVDIKFIN